MQHIKLALQGGGALGAITWGVLDRLLEEGDFAFDAASGASAGAMNAVALAHGWAVGGRDGARESLAAFWGAVGAAAQSLPLPAPFLLGLTRFFTPQQLNPFDINPLRAIVDRSFDFGRLRRASPIGLFVAATQVRTGRLRVFTERELTTEHLLASACLPALHHPVQVDGEDYWDGGYSANPPLFPLARGPGADDLLIVPLLPRERAPTPTSMEGIRARLTEIQFATAFQVELRDLVAAVAAARRNWWPFGSPRPLRALRLHRIDSDLVAQQVDTVKSQQVGPALLHALRDRGRECAAAWLSANRGAIGRRSSVDWGESAV